MCAQKLLSQDENYSGWHIRHSGSLQIHDEGALGGDKSLLIVERTLPGSGLKFDTNGVLGRGKEIRIHCSS